MHEVLREALEPILRDIATLRAPAPIIKDEPWADDPDTASAMAWSLDGSGTGLYVSLDAPEVYRIASVSDQVQEWVIEELSGTPYTNWPPCPTHPATHPLRIPMQYDVAMWTCPQDGTQFWPIGSIPRTGDLAPSG